MIYVLTDGRGRVKVGRSRNPAKRLPNLQTGDADPHGLRLLVKAGDPATEACLERNFHLAFAAQRCAGGTEWFRDCPQIRAWCFALSLGCPGVGEMK